VQPFAEFVYIHRVNGLLNVDEEDTELVRRVLPYLANLAGGEAIDFVLEQLFLFKFSLEPDEVYGARSLMLKLHSAQ